MRRETLIQLLALGLMFAFLAGGGVLATQVSGSAGRNRLVYADAAEDGDPPEVALGIAMGAFRGVFVNWLWIRANDLKEEGKYHEAVDLARTITRLQPRMPRVWSFHAWNLAYNISVTTNTPQERWNWVKSGIDLIRKEGIKSNPGALMLYRELGWIHLHKIQAFMDDAHQFYKRQFAYDWTIVLGAPPKFPKDVKDTMARRQFYVDNWLTPIAEAPDSLDELYAKRPSAKALADRITRESGVKPGKDLLEAVEVTKSLNRMTRGMGNAETVAIPGPLGAIITDPATQEDGRELIRTLRKVMLRDDYAMDIERMIRYTEKYGPLDWRHASTHAVYWSAMGSEEAILRANEQNQDDMDLVNSDRLTVQALQDLFRTGTVFFDILNPQFFRQLPSVDYLDSYGEIMRENKARSKFDSDSKTYRFYAAGYENFLRDAIRYLYRMGEREQAERYYRDLRMDTELNMNNAGRRFDLTKTLDDFVVNEIKNDDRTTSPVVALQEITGAFIAAYTQGLLEGDEKMYTKSMDYARTFYRVYQDQQKFSTFVSAAASGTGRMGFPPFDYMAAQVLAGMIEEAGVPEGVFMYRAAPEDLRGRAYVFLERTVMRARLNEMATPPDDGTASTNDAPKETPFDRWFPAPPPQDLARYRAEMERATKGLSDNAGDAEMK